LFFLIQLTFIFIIYRFYFTMTRRPQPTHPQLHPPNHDHCITPNPRREQLLAGCQQGVTKRPENDDDCHNHNYSSTPNHRREQLLTGWKRGATERGRGRLPDGHHGEDRDDDGEDRDDDDEDRDDRDDEEEDRDNRDNDGEDRDNDDERTNGGGKRARANNQEWRAGRHHHHRCEQMGCANGWHQGRWG